MAYWPVPENAKRSLSHYEEHLALSMEMLAGCNLHFIGDSNTVFSSVEALCRQHRINLHFEKVLIEDLRKRSDMELLLQRARNFGSKLKSPPADFQRDKGLIHYWRDLRQSGDDAFKRVFCIWHSKIDLLHEAASENPFSSTEFAWLDASISRFNGRRAGWDFRLVRCVPGAISHYPNIMRKNGKELALNASFIIGDKAAINRLHEGYEKAFSDCLSEDYPNDEETVLDSMVRRTPQLFSVIRGEQPPPAQPSVPAPALASGEGPRKVLVVGTFRSGTNAMKVCLEEYFDVEVTFNEWFWKHGVPPTGIRCPIPRDVPIIVMSKSPCDFQESLYPFWLHRRPNLDAGKSISEFIRKELIVFDNSGGNLGRPKYSFRCPTDYWNHFYFSWLSWSEMSSQCKFVSYDRLENSTEAEILAIAKRFHLSRKKQDPIRLPSERVGPHVPTARQEGRFKLTETDRQWISDNAHHLVMKSLGYRI